MSGHGHRSSISQHSRSASQFLNDTDELTDAELIKQVNDIKQQIKVNLNVVSTLPANWQRPGKRHWYDDKTTTRRTNLGRL